MLFKEFREIYNEDTIELCIKKKGGFNHIINNEFTHLFGLDKKVKYEKDLSKYDKLKVVSINYKYKNISYWDYNDIELWAYVELEEYN